MSRPVREAKVLCGVCRKPYGSQGSLNSHGYKAHPGIERDCWQPGWVDQRSTKNRKPRALPVVEQPIALGRTVFIPGQGNLPVRRIPDESERHQAEDLAGLPWMKAPSTPAACKEVVKAAEAMLQGARSGIKLLEPTAEAFFRWARDYAAALGERLSKRAA